MAGKKRLLLRMDRSSQAIDFAATDKSSPFDTQLAQVIAAAEDVTDRVT